MHEHERRAVARLERLAAVSAALASSVELGPTLDAIVDAFVPTVADGVIVALNASFEGHTRAAGRHTEASASRVLSLEAHGVVFGELRLFGTVDETDDELFVTELARRSAVALDAARTFGDLRTALNARDELLSILGHELRTPLTTLRMCLFGLSHFGGPDVGIANRQVARLERLVEQLLDVTRIGAGRLVLEREELDLHELVGEVIAAADHSDAQRALLKVHVEGETRGTWDRVRLSQLVTNLISNALKFGEQGDVDISLAGDGATVRLSVQDRGIGIPEAARARIFERFERAVSSREYAGVGVGLWICRQIVAAHGGSIRVESEAGAGSTFVVELPKHPPLDA